VFYGKGPKEGQGEMSAQKGGEEVSEDEEMSLSKTVKSLLKTVAPTIATALGGPVGGVAVKFLADKFVGGDTGQVEDFLIGANPEQLAQVKMADMEFKKEMRKLDIDLEKLHAGDRDSARRMVLAKGFGPQLSLSVLYTSAYAVVLYVFIGGHVMVPPSQMTLFGSLLGVLSAAQVQIINFWFGSSSGSKEKTAKLGAS
jgi:hypothetical protein